MKISFKPIVIAGNRRKDGTWAVSIRVTFKGVSRRLPTAIVCTATDLTRTCKIKSTAVLAATERIVTQMRDAVTAISPFDLEAMDVDDVVARIRSILSRSTFHLDFFEFADEFLAGKTLGTRKNYLTALHAFQRYLGRDELDINEISTAMVQDFYQFVNAEPKMQVYKGRVHIGSTQKITGPSYIRRLSHIHLAAKERYNDEDTGFITIPRSPFSKMHLPRVNCQGQQPLPDDVMQHIIDARSDDPLVDMALAALVLSFGTMGANLADLYAARAFKGEVWRYFRRKTTGRRADKAEQRVYIQPEMRPYIERLGGRSSGDWWLTALHHYRTENITHAINYGLRKWCEEQDLPRFTFYAARHTFATLARRLGMEKATIDEALVHKGDFEMADIYAERNWDLINATNRVTIGHFRWSAGEGGTLEEVVQEP